MKDIINDMGLSGNFWNTVRDFLTGGVSRIIQVTTDTWSKASDQEKRLLIRQSLLQGAESVIYGDINSVEETLRAVHAQVEGDENWSIWNKRNPWIMPMLKKAEAEATLAKRLIADGKMQGYEAIEPRILRAEFEYVDPYLIQSLIQPIERANDSSQSSSNGELVTASFASGITDWVKSNPPLAIGITIAVVGGVFLLANTKKSKKINTPEAPQKIGVLGLK